MKEPAADPRPPGGSRSLDSWDPKAPAGGPWRLLCRFSGALRAPHHLAAWGLRDEGAISEAYLGQFRLLHQPLLLHLLLLLLLSSSRAATGAPSSVDGTEESPFLFFPSLPAKAALEMPPVDFVRAMPDPWRSPLGAPGAPAYPNGTLNESIQAPLQQQQQQQVPQKQQQQRRQSWWPWGAQGGDKASAAAEGPQQQQQQQRQQRQQQQHLEHDKQQQQQEEEEDGRLGPQESDGSLPRFFRSQMDCHLPFKYAVEAAAAESLLPALRRYLWLHAEPPPLMPLFLGGTRPPVPFVLPSAVATQGRP